MKSFGPCMQQQKKNTLSGIYSSMFITKETLALQSTGQCIR